MALGKNIQYLRELSGLTRIAVARGVGKDNDQPIYALETRDSSRSDMAVDLAGFFKVDLQVLLTHDLAGMTLEEIRALRPNGTPNQAAPPLKLVPVHQGEPGLVPVEEIIRLMALYGRSTPKGREYIFIAANTAEKQPLVSADVGTADDKSE